MSRLLVCIHFRAQNSRIIVLEVVDFTVVPQRNFPTVMQVKFCPAVGAREAGRAHNSNRHGQFNNVQLAICHELIKYTILYVITIVQSLGSVLSVFFQL